jgi:Predicted sugar phosphatases of the HAD superfamily
MLKGIGACLIDLDGTVFQGDRLIRGADRAIAALRASGRKIVFVSNRGNLSRTQGVEKLRKAGIEAEKDELLLASTAAARLLKSHYPNASVWTLGDPGLGEELADHGIRLSAAPETADWLVVSLHETLTYGDLNDAFQAVRHGARIMATNLDRTFPKDGKQAIDVAGMAGAIEAASGRRVEIVVGKPSYYMGEAALAAAGLPGEQCAMIGDSLESDIGLGKAHGMRTVLVMTGSTDTAMLEKAERRPDFVIESLADLEHMAEYEEDAS